MSSKLDKKFLVDSLAKGARQAAVDAEKRGGLKAFNTTGHRHTKRPAQTGTLLGVDDFVARAEGRATPLQTRKRRTKVA